MNKTVQVNISGYVFHIEEAAYEILLSYLKAIERNFSDESERTEIMKDIESRIAELFQAANGTSKEVITDVDVHKMIEVMGQPEDYADNEFVVPEEDRNNQSHESSTTHSERRMFRDKDNAMIGGVCSGLGAYFGIDATIIRIIFVFMALLGLSGVVLYLILLFVVPEAISANDKLKMRGKPITVNTIKETAQDLKRTFDEQAGKHGKYGKVVSRTVDRGVKATSRIAKLITKVVGFGFLVGGIFMMLLLISVFIGDGGLIPFWGDRQSITLSEGMDILYDSSFQSGLSFMAILFVLFIPIFSLIYSGVKLLFDIKTKLRYIALSLAIVWVLSIGCLVLTSLQLGVEFKDEATITESLETPAALETLYVQVGADDVFSDNIAFSHHWENSDLIEIQEDNIYLGYPKLIIVESAKDSTFKIEVQKSSRGINQREAILNSEQISYDIALQQGVLNLAPYMSIARDEKFRGQDLEILIRVPEGKSVILGENIERILVPISAKNQQSDKRVQFSNTEWKNTNNEMIFVDQN